MDLPPALSDFGLRGQLDNTVFFGLGEGRRPLAQRSHFLPISLQVSYLLGNPILAGGAISAMAWEHKG